MTLKIANEQGEGWYLPISAAPLQNITDPTEAAILQERCVSQPLATFTQALKLSGNHRKITRTVYVHALGTQPSPFTKFAEEARRQGWPVEELPTHHFTMISMPKQTADVLIRHAAEASYHGAKRDNLSGKPALFSAERDLGLR